VLLLQVARAAVGFGSYGFLGVSREKRGKEKVQKEDDSNRVRS